MKCKNCGFEIPAGKVSVCPKCGKKISKKFPVWAIVLIVLAVLALPALIVIGIVASIAIPTLTTSSRSIANRSIFRKDLLVLDTALKQSAVTDGIYSSTDTVWNKGLKNKLIITKDFSDRIVLGDSSEIKYQKLRDNCVEKPENDSEINEQTACAILTIDVDGFKKGLNRQSKVGDIADRFTVLLYSDAVVMMPNSAEEKILLNPSMH